MKRTLLIAALSFLIAGQSMAQMTVWTRRYNHTSVYDTITGTYLDIVDTISIAHPYRLSEVDSIVIAPVPPQVPKVEPQEGKVTILWHIEDAAVCSKLVLAGSYNGWSTDTSQLVAFTPVEGFEQWYVAVVEPALEPDENDGSILKIRPCQLDIDGTFDWSYQWFGSDTYPCTLHSGDASLVEEYSNEYNVCVYRTEDVVVIESHAFKSDPCAPRTYADITFTVTTPALSSEYTLYIAGGLNNWQGEPLTPNADRTFWTLTKEHVRTDNYIEYKYLLDGDWTYVELGKTTAEGCANDISNRTIGSAYINDVVENFDNVTANRCTENL